ncbi:hypothetical protein STEG23_002691 [Scotinomys teguina]
MCRLSWFLDPGGWSKAAAVGLYFIFPEICTLSLYITHMTVLSDFLGASPGVSNITGKHGSTQKGMMLSHFLGPRSLQTPLEEEGASQPLTHGDLTLPPILHVSPLTHGDLTLPLILHVSPLPSGLSRFIGPRNIQTLLEEKSGPSHFLEPRSTQTPLEEEDQGSPRHHRTKRTQEHPDTIGPRHLPLPPSKVEMGRSQCKSTYNNIKNKTSPESSPPPTPRPEHCSVDKAEENDLKNSLMKMLEEDFGKK